MFVTFSSLKNFRNSPNWNNLTGNDGNITWVTLSAAWASSQSALCGRTAALSERQVISDTNVNRTHIQRAEATPVILSHLEPICWDTFSTYVEALGHIRYGFFETLGSCTLAADTAETSFRWRVKKAMIAKRLQNKLDVSRAQNL